MCVPQAIADKHNIKTIEDLSDPAKVAVVSVATALPGSSAIRRMFGRPEPSFSMLAITPAPATLIISTNISTRR